MKIVTGTLRGCTRPSVTLPWTLPRLTHTTAIPITSIPATSSTDSPDPRRKRPIDNTTKWFLYSGVFFMLLSTFPGFQDQKAFLKVLNPDKFLSYTITEKERVSPDTFLMTLTPEIPAPNVPLPYLKKNSTLNNPSTTWAFPLWSVEAKQPEIQIVREYTPLPPLTTTEATSGTLRLLIRVLPDGEVSRYLDRQLPASHIELRGPYPTLLFTSPPTSPDDEILFIAGGTSIAPALQAAHAVLTSPTPGRVKILWAVHSRADIDTLAPLNPTRAPKARGWFPGSSSTPNLVDIGSDAVKTPTQIATMLRDLQMTHGLRFSAHIAITGENGLIDEQAIKKALGISGKGVKKVENPGRTKPYLPIAEGPYAEKQPKVVTRPGGTGAYKVVIVSGPDGFVEKYAGGIVKDGAPAFRRIRGGGLVERILDKSGGALEGEWQIVNLD